MTCLGSMLSCLMLNEIEIELQTFWVYVDLDKASTFRFNEFGTDGGRAAKELLPKLNTFRRNFSARFGFDLPVIDVSFGYSVD